MATEAQRLISISLSKIALSRSQRGGFSLHRNLLVASVLQKARYVFMEETYQLMNYPTMGMGPTAEAVEEDAPASLMAYEQECNNCLPSEAQVQPQAPESDSGSSSFHEMAAAAVVGLPSEDPESSPVGEADKENSAPYGDTVTYLDLDTSEQSREVLVDTTPKCNNLNGGIPLSPQSPKCLKRRRGVVVSDWETEEAVSSILPKRQRRGWAESPSSSQSPCEAFLLQDELSELCAGVGAAVAAAAAAEEDEDGLAQTAANAMEIDHITSLVSIFSFGGLVCPSGEVGAGGKLTRSVSTPDLCSAQAQAKDVGSGAMGVVQRPFLAMTV